MKDLEKELKEQYRQLGDVLNQQEIVNNQIAKRYMNSRITMFWFDWVLYALVVAAIAFVIYAAFVQPDTLWIAFLAGFLVVSMTRLFGMTPKMVELTPEAVCIHLWVGKKTIDYDTIAKVERFTYKGNNIRLFGTSGSKLRVGWFWNSEIGVYQSYVGDKYDTVLLSMKSGKKITFSAANADEFVNAIEGNIESL